jgi:hypothetical protein
MSHNESGSGTGGNVMGDPYTRMVKFMQEKARGEMGSEFIRAIVVNTAPLSVKINDTVVDVNLYCNAALLLGLNPSDVATSETALKQCLTSFYNAFELHVNDVVLVKKVGNIIYIICKVVSAS